MRPTPTQFQPDSLPLPRDFYRDEGVTNGRERENSKGYALGNCAFHPSKSKKSFSVNLRSGGYRCFGCDAHGDMVSYVMRKYNLTFREACIRLGAWKDVSAQDRQSVNAKLRQEKAKRERVEQEAQAAQEKLHRLRGEIHTTARIQRETEQQLSESLRRGDPAEESDRDTLWTILSLAVDDLRLSETEYDKLAGL